MLFCKGVTPEIAVEVKLSSNPQVNKGFYIACDDLNVKHRFLVYSGKDVYLLRPEVYAVPLEGLCE